MDAQDLHYQVVRTQLFLFPYAVSLGCPITHCTQSLITSVDISQRMRHGQIVHFSQLWDWCEYPLAFNTIERVRFLDYISGGTRTPDEVHTDFEESVKRWLVLVQQSRVPPRRQRDGDNVETENINVIADRLARESGPGAQPQRLANFPALGVDTTSVHQEEPNWSVCSKCLMTTARCHLSFLSQSAF